MQLHENDFWRGKSQTVMGDGVRLNRLALHEHIDVCVAEYRGTRGARLSALSNRIELGIQLSGGLLQRGHRSGPRRYGPGSIHVLAEGEAYDLAYEAEDRLAVVVWFSVRMDGFCRSREAAREVVFSEPVPEPDSRLIDLARHVYEARERTPCLSEQVASGVEAFLRRHCDLSKKDRVVAARRQLDEHFDRELYLHHVAEEAGVLPVTLLRQFSKRYGVTPIQYRIKTRLNHAARWAWLRPELSVKDIAAMCGFSNLPYFHRQFSAYYGTTPARHRQNALYGI